MEGLDHKKAGAEWRKLQYRRKVFDEMFPRPGTLLGHSTYCWQLADSCESCFKEHGMCAHERTKMDERLTIGEAEQIRDLFRKYIRENPELAEEIAGD